MLIAIKKYTNRELDNIKCEARVIAEEYILDILLFHKASKLIFIRNKLRIMLRQGLLNNYIITIENKKHFSKINNMGIPYNNNFSQYIQEFFQNIFINFKKIDKTRISIQKALKVISYNEAQRLLNNDKIVQIAIQNVEKQGIIFLDEIDKIISKQYNNNNEISRDGVQRDLLPIIEGSSIITKFGIINTTKILFIAAGAFYVNKPTDLIPELQGRFPIKITLNNLEEQDFVSILYKTKNNLIEQYQALLATEHVFVCFEKSGIQAVGKYAIYMNTEIENIGARRLYSIMEELIENISYNSPYKNKYKTYIYIDEKYVIKKLNKNIQFLNLSNNIL